MLKIKHTIGAEHQSGENVCFEFGRVCRGSFVGIESDLCISMYNCDGDCCFVSPRLQSCNGKLAFKIPSLCSGVYRFCVDAFPEPECHDDKPDKVQQVICDVRIDNAKATTVHELDLQEESEEGVLPGV